MEQTQQDDTCELLFRVNQKAEDKTHYQNMWAGRAPLKLPYNFVYDERELNRRDRREMSNTESSRRQGTILLAPEPKIDAMMLLEDLGKGGLALVDQNLCLQEECSDFGIETLKLIARYTLRRRDALFEDEQEIGEDSIRTWVNNLFALIQPSLWEVAAFRNPSGEQRHKTHISFKRRTDRPKLLPNVKRAPNVLRWENGVLSLKAA